MTNDDGTPRDAQMSCGDYTRALIENMGDASEALRQCYGMVWWLAEIIAYLNDMDFCGTRRPSRDKILEVIEQARENYQDGVRLGMGEG